MIEEEYFSAFPFPCLLKARGRAIYSQTGGALFPAPKRTEASGQFSYYITAVDGWTKCPLGYAVYARDLPGRSEYRLIVFGLKVRGISDVHGKSDALSLKTSPETVEKTIERFISAWQSTESFLGSIISNGVHEVRNINKDLYNAIYALKSNLDRGEGSFDENMSLAKNVEALSELLRVRADLFDLISNPTLATASGGKFHVYRSFDRIRKSLSSSAKAKKLRLYMRGYSIGRVEGIKLFDVIPYVLLQNAIKYAPDGSEVIVDIRETDDEITIQIKSTGPVIQGDEQERIFLPGYRGVNARKVEPQGSGIGLHFVRRVLEMHEGATIQIFQDVTDEEIGGVPFAETYFNIRFHRVD